MKNLVTILLALAFSTTSFANDAAPATDKDKVAAEQEVGKDGKKVEDKKEAAKEVK